MDEAAGPEGQYSVRQHYEVEVELADRLRTASKEERLGGLYRAIYAEENARIPGHPLVVQSQDPVAQERAVRHQLRLLLPFLGPNTVFAEVGPGDCALALAVASRVKTVYAVDVTDSLVGKGFRPENFHFVGSDGVTVSVPAGTVHVVYSNQVLEHLHPDDAYDHLLAVHTALAPGGRFVCITPNRLSGPWDVSRHFDTRATGLHLREYTISESVDLLRTVGFAVNLFASYHGHRVAPRVSERAVRVVEAGLEGLPTALRRPLASCLTAVKVMATKPEEGTGLEANVQPR